MLTPPRPIAIDRVGTAAHTGALPVAIVARVRRADGAYESGQDRGRIGINLDYIVELIYKELYVRRADR